MTARLVVSAGTGPEEARRFVALLAGHLEAVCGRLGVRLSARQVHGPEAAPWSVAWRVEGEGVEALRALEGSHALVARSPRRGASGRKRWFARVTLVDEPARGTTAVRAAELELTACRARGPGGQHVNKRSTAVRVTHRPTGLTVRADERRSQRDNRRAARRRLEDALAERATALEARARSELRLAHHRLERGAPVCTYRLDDRGGLVALEGRTG